MRLFNEEGAYPSCNYYRVVLYGYISCQNAPQALLFGLYSFFHPVSQRARSNIHGFIIMFIVTKLDIVNEEARCVYVCKLVEFAIWYLVSGICYLVSGYFCDRRVPRSNKTTVVSGAHSSPGIGPRRASRDGPIFGPRSILLTIVLSLWSYRTGPSTWKKRRAQWA